LTNGADPTSRAAGSFDVEGYIQACASSSRRSQGALRIVLVFALLVAAVVWNGRPGSWLNWRLSTYERALEFQEGTDSARVTQYDAGARNLARARSHEYVRDAVVAFRERRFQDVLVVHVPFLGIWFDVNDLGLFAGAAFLLALIWYYLCLSNELAIIATTLREARQALVLRPVLHRLAATQVVAVLPGVGWRWRRIWVGILRAALFLPLLIETYLVLVDSGTLAGGAFAEYPARLQLRLSALVLLGIAATTLASVRLAASIDGIWRDSGYEGITVRELEAGGPSNIRIQRPKAARWLVWIRRLVAGRPRR
jgi:hypothetical protein